MKILFFLFGLYGLVVAFGFNVAQASSNNADCTGAECEVQMSDLETESIIQDIEALLAKIEQKISMERLHAIITKVAEENPQVRELVEIIQQYGVLSEIELSEQSEERPAE